VIKPSAVVNGSKSDVAVNLTPNAITVLENRYLNRDDEGNIIETPAELFRRVARALSAVEEKWGVSAKARQEVEDAFYGLMTQRRFMPNSPTLMNAGRRLGMLSACFVLPLEDSIPEIMETARQIALVQRAGGGTGIDLSRLRPRGSIVRSSGGTTDGPLSFLKMLSAVTDAIQQGAFRRGANMGMLRVDHPDILPFIDIKSDLSQVTNYNLSVSMTDAFMKSLRATPQALHRVVDPHTGKVGALRRENDEVDYDADVEGKSPDHWTTREIWDRIVQRAWGTGEPGLIFIDEINRYNQTPHVFEMRAAASGAVRSLQPGLRQPGSLLQARGPGRHSGTHRLGCPEIHGENLDPLPR
jgi:ribonucleoside-diphosphate reductase alpha chain